MSTRKTGPGGPDEPHNIPVRFYAVTLPGTPASDRAKIERLMKELRDAIREALRAERILRRVRAGRRKSRRRLR